MDDVYGRRCTMSDVVPSRRFNITKRAALTILRSRLQLCITRNSDLIEISEEKGEGQEGEEVCRPWSIRLSSASFGGHALPSILF